MPRASCPNSPQNSDMDNYFGLKKQTKYSTDRYASSPNLDTVNKKPIKKLHRKKKNSKEILARFHSDVVGVVFLEVSNARDLPPVKNCKLQCLSVPVKCAQHENVLHNK
jgi:hypothetical protein